MFKRLCLFLLVSLWCLGGCAAARPQHAQLPAAPDYAQAESWAFLPVGQTDKPVDVFYVYPTIFGGDGPTRMDITDEDLRHKADVQILINTGVFTDTANLFAPYYRQASIEVVWMNELEGEALLSDGYHDVIRAFEYYMEHYNNGRPFILAGFSQGSMALLELMKAEFHNPQWQKQLVAAYLIGYSVTAEDLAKYPWLKMAQGEADTGVIVSYNTQLPHSGQSFVLKKGALGINPVNWKTDATVAPAAEHKGAIIFNAVTGEIVEEVPHLSDAYLEAESGALVVQVDPVKYNASQAVFAAGVLHMYDYMFFYNNLKENAARRAAAWFENKKAS